VCVEEELESTTAGEKRNGYGPWETDIYGTEQVLIGKRRVRGWKEDLAEKLGADLEPVVQRLMKYRSGAGLFPENLPWE